MKYHGQELIEMTPANWDGKSREMLVWWDGSPEPSQLTVIGYDPTENGWIDSESLTHWSHCAEIPAEEHVSGKKLRRMTNRELADLLATGKAEKCYPYYANGHDLTKVYRSHSYYRGKEDSACAKSVLIRYTGTDEWVKPMIEEY